MAPSTWKLSIQPSDASAKREITVAADTWQAALAAGRAQLGERGPLATAASVVSASGEVTLLDPSTGHQYVLVPDAPDNADNAQRPTRTPALMPAPSLARAQQTLPYSPERAAALEREFAAAQATLGISSRPPPAQPTSSRSPAVANDTSAARPGAPSSQPPPQSGRSSSLPPPSPVLDALARPNLRAVPSPTPSEPGTGGGTADALTLIGSRDVERGTDTTLTYRERAYLLPGGGSREQLEQLLYAKLGELQAELATRPRGKYVTLAVFDQRPGEDGQRAPLATLEWKDWRGAPVFLLPREEPPADTAVRAPTGGSAPRAGEPGDLDARLASAFEAMHDLHFADTPRAALELSVGLLERLVPCEALSGCLYDLDTDELRFVSLTGVGAPERQASAVPASEGLIGAALSMGDEVVVVQQAARNARFDAAIDGRLGLEVDDLAYVPLRQHGQVFGMLQLINRSAAGGFSEADVAVLSYVAGQLSRFFAQRRGAHDSA